MKNKGQSIVEMVFAIGILGLVLTGVVALIVKSIGGQTKTNARDKAVLLGSVIIEEMVALSKNDPGQFWQKNEVLEQVWPGFDNYLYSITYADVSAGGSCVPASRCTEMTVDISWQENETKTVSFSRYFSR